MCFVHFLNVWEFLGWVGTCSSDVNVYPTLKDPTGNITRKIWQLCTQIIKKKMHTLLPFSSKSGWLRLECKRIWKYYCMVLNMKTLEMRQIYFVAIFLHWMRSPLRNFIPVASWNVFTRGCNHCDCIWQTKHTLYHQTRCPVNFQSGHTPVCKPVGCPLKGLTWFLS